MKKDKEGRELVLRDYHLRVVFRIEPETSKDWKEDRTQRLDDCVRGAMSDLSVEIERQTAVYFDIDATVTATANAETPSEQEAAS